MGVQETRCPEICSLVDGICWLGGGADKGSLGVELLLLSSSSRPVL